ncbi:uncharacterized protein LOC120625345 [Pararge aegeria]|uniref:Jg18768 protein n=3 Tax=Pararge aegeria TaxID=116150 RepID=A0A8S4S9G1_9NEOP|nr:uncharacterized protein LOC120625345 [Pararge aegeria]CAH2249522.1 jg18768 [Pararge aegeria aegeria]
MSFDVSWDVSKYREEHESEEHWLLRKAFMERWKNDYSEERLVCLARVFFNIEFMGCRYPTEIMQEVARLSQDVAQQYRKLRKSKLQRTFVSASDAAEDRAKGVKRSGGVIIDSPAPKSTKINFVPQGHSVTNEITTNVTNISDDETNENDDLPNAYPIQNKTKICNEKLNDSNNEPKSNHKDSLNKTGMIQSLDPNDYFKEMLNMKCLDIRSFTDRLFNSTFGRMVLLIRPWSSKFGNIQSSCQVCHIPITSTYENNCFSLIINECLVAQATGSSKPEARSAVEAMAWNRLKGELVSVLIKEQWIAQGDRISVNDVSGKKPEFGTPVDNSVATKMMKLMGWKGGGLGVDSQGIAEPIKPHLQMVNRAGLGSNTTDIRQLRRAGFELMRRYIASDTFDVDLVFSADFNKEERAVMHHCAQKTGLASKSYGADVDRFLVVKKKLDPFSLVRAIVEKGGNTTKYQVFLPTSLRENRK